MPPKQQTQQTGRAGEYYIAAELNRRGLDAVVFSGNVPHFDAVAVTPRRKTLYIQVKTQRGAGWQVDVRVREQRPNKAMFWILVLLLKEEPPRYWVIPDEDMKAIIQQTYDDKKPQFDKAAKKSNYQCKVEGKRVQAWEGGWDRLR